LDSQTAAYYRSKANAHGISLSEFLRQTLVQGVIAESVTEFEKRLQKVANSIQENAVGGIPESLWLSVFTSEELLAAIVEQRDVQELYAAQNRAKAKLERNKER
jgi:hypothetical protein